MVLQFDIQKIFGCLKLQPIYKKRLSFILGYSFKDKQIDNIIKTDRCLIKNTFIKKSTSLTNDMSIDRSQD